MTKEIPLKTYKKIHQLVPIACVDLVIVKNNKVLLCKRRNKPAQGTFWFPGGRIHKNETFMESVRRKLLQETNLTAKKIKLLGVDETIFEDGPFGPGTHTINVVFLITPTTGEIKNDDQHEEYIWADTKTKSLHPYIKKYIKLALLK